MIRITTDRAIRRKIEEVREKDFERRMIDERFEYMEKRLHNLERDFKELMWKIEAKSDEEKTQFNVPE